MIYWQEWLDSLNIAGHANQWAAILLMMLGFYVVLSSRHLVKKLIGLGIFQTSVLLLYISGAWIKGTVAPILQENPTITYSNPVPHVLMLTAIVVGVATLAVGLALVVRIRSCYGTVEEDLLVAMDNADSERGNAAVLRQLKDHRGGEW